MPHYNLNNNQPISPSSSQQSIISSQGALDHPPITNEMQLTEAVEQNNASAVLSLLQEVVEPTTRRNAYLLAYHLGHIDAALVLLKAGVPLIGSLETLAYNAISKNKFDAVSFDNLSAYIREHGLSFNPNSRHGPKQESLQECATRMRTHLAMAWLDQFQIDAEEAAYDKEIPNQNDLELFELGLPSPTTALKDFDDPWGFLEDCEGFEQVPDKIEDPTLLFPLSDLNFDHSFLPNTLTEPQPSSSAQSLIRSSSSTPANFIDLTLEDGISELPGQSFDCTASLQEIEQFKRDWAGVIENRTTFLNNTNIIISLLQTAKQRNIRFDINASNHNQNTALHLACGLGHLKIVQELLDARADVNIKNSWGYTPLHLACNEGYWEIVKQLLDARADVNITSLLNGNSPLYLACKRGRREIVKQLLDARADVNIKNYHGYTPLHSACLDGNADVVRQLLEAGALVDAKNNFGKTPLDLAFSLEIRQLLESARAAQLVSLQQAPSQQEIDQFRLNWSKALREGASAKFISLLQRAKQKNISLPINDKNEWGYNPLHLACTQGISLLVNLLIEAKADLNVKENLQSSPLHLACRNGHTEAVRLLIEAKAKIDDPDKYGDIPLHDACQKGHLQAAKLLIAAGADINAKGLYSNTPLHNASFEGHSEIVKFLIQAKAKVNDLNQQGNSPLHIACREGHSDVVEHLLAAGAIIDRKNRRGETPFELAKTDEIRQLLRNARTVQQASLQPLPSQQEIDQFNRDWLSAKSEKNCDKLLSLLQQAKQKRIPLNANLSSAEYGYSPLYIASAKGHTELVRELIEANVSVNLANYSGLTPLHVACREGHSEVVGLLIEAKANFNVNNKEQNSPLRLACRNGHTEAVRLLIEAKANINDHDKNGDTPLHDACFEGHSEIVKLLIQAKAKVNDLNRKGNSLLHIACRQGHSAVVEHLLAAGAMIDRKNRRGETPFQIAKTPYIRQLLENARAALQASLQQPPSQQEIDRLKSKWSSALSHRNCEKLLSLLRQARQKGISFDVNVKMNSDFNALYLASSQGHTELVRLLIETNANINDQGKHGDAALHKACLKGHLQVAELLIKAGADINAKGKHKNTPLQNASSRGHSQVVRLLIQAKANVNDLNQKGNSSLHLACGEGFSDVAQQLLVAGAIIDGKNKNDETPFEVAKTDEIRQLLRNARAVQQASLQPTPSQQETEQFRFNYSEALREGISAKFISLLQLANQKKISLPINDKNKSGYTALHLACKAGNSLLVKLLIEANADLNIKDNEQNSALHLACRNRHIEAVRQLIEAKANINVRDKLSDTPLHEACIKGDLQIAELLIAAGADVNAKGQYQCTPLYDACWEGHAQVVKFLIQEKAIDINAKNNTGTTALHLACKVGNSLLIKLLIEANADLNIKDNEQDSPLHLACRNGHTEAVRQLIEANADLNIKDNEQNSPLHLACRNGHTEAVRQLIEDKAKIDDRDKFGDIPLHEACRKGHLQAAELLIAAGADVNAKGHYSNTPLHDASSEGHLEIVKFLIQAKGKVNDLNQNGNSPLHLACRLGHSDVVEHLLASGAIIDGTNKNGETPFEVAKTDEIRYLLRNALPAQQDSLQPFPSEQEIKQFKQDWADVIKNKTTFLNNTNKIIFLLRTAKQKNIRLEINASDQNQNTALHWACELGHQQLVRELLEAGAQVNKSSKGNTPLHFACRKGHLEIVKQLLDAGAEVNIKTSWGGYTPLHFACKQGHWETAKQLLDAGIDVNITSSNGHTPLHLASETGHLKVAKQLLAAGALIDAKNNSGNTPLDIAGNRYPAIRQLLENARGAQLVSLQQAPSQQEIDPFRFNWSQALREGNSARFISLLQRAKEKNISLPINDKNKSGYTALHWACTQGISLLVNLLIEAKADLNVKENQQSSPLHLACRNGHTEAVRQLIEAKAKIDDPNKFGNIPLHDACQKGHLQAAKLLIAAGADINAKDLYSNTPLHKASFEGHSEIVKFLIQAKAKVNDLNQHGNSPLHIACGLEHSDVVEHLLAAGAIIVIKNRKNETPFEVAKTDEIRQLLRNALAVQQPSFQPIPSQQEIDKFNRDWVTALSEKNCSKLHSLLQEARQKKIPCKWHVKNEDEHNALQLACIHGHSELVQLLIEAEAHLDVKDLKRRSSLLHLACSKGHVAVARQLIEADAIINGLDNNKDTPLHKACLKGHLQVAELLIEAGADINAMNEFRNTPLHDASSEGHLEIVKLLLQAKAKVNDLNQKGNSPLHLACREGHSEVVQHLLAAGANIDAKNRKSETPFQVAKKDEIRQLLRNARTAQQNSFQTSASQQEIDQFNMRWAKGLKQTNSTNLLSLLQQAKQKGIPLDINAKNKVGYTALHAACWEKNSELARLLIEARANINDKNKDGHSPLHMASMNGSAELVSLLIEAKANIHDKNITGDTPLHLASLLCYSDVIRLLIKAGASLEAQNNQGQTPLDVALPTEIRELLENTRAAHQASLQSTPSQQEIDQLNRDWSSALSKINCSKLLSLLQQARQKNIPLNVDAQNDLKWTALHSACFYGDTALVKLLIDAKASVNLGNENGHTPLHLASKGGHSEVVRQLLDAGASIEAEDTNSKTALDYASTPEIIELLEVAHNSAHLRTEAPTQSRTPNPRKLKNAGKHLLKRVAEHYGSRYHAALTDLLIKNRGRWGIDFANDSSRRIRKSEWLAPFVQFLEAHPRSETASQVVKQQLAFFQFSDSSGNEALTDDLSSAESFVEECLRENTQQPIGNQAPLSDYFAMEACQTLFSLKLREWDYMVNHPERYFPASERLTDANSALCPCFILAQDQNQVRAHIMQAQFGKMGFVESFGKDAGQEALRFLFTEVLKRSEVPSERIREDESVVLSWEEYNTLERYLAELPPSDMPKLLAPMREKLIQPIEEVSETDRSSNETESASDEEPSYRRGQDREERPAKRRERSPTENPEQHSSLESFRTFNDLIGSRSAEKRTTRENDGASSGAKRHRKNAYDVPEHQGAFVPLEEQLIPFPADVRSKRQRRGKEGEIPEVGSFAGLPSLNDDQAFAFSDNPYDSLNRTSIKKIKEAVAREVARESVVLRQIKPYSYPIVEKLDSLPPAKPAFSWTRALKPYQQETLQELLRYDSHGLSKLLSLEMGLGKTYVFAELLIDKIATSPSPQLHVVSAPVSVVGQVEQELSKLLLEASITAWQLTGKRPSSPELWPQCKQLLDYANNHPDALKSVLRVLPYFKDAHVYGMPASKQFFSQPGLQSQLFSMTQEHLVEIETLLQERPEEREQFEKQLDAIYKDLNLRTCSKQELLSYFKTSQPIVKLCNIAGRILDLYPGRTQLGEPLPICSDQELASLRNLGLSPSQMEKEHFINAWAAKKSDPKLKSLSETPTAPKICLIGLKDLHRVRDQFPQKHVGSLIIDEANRAQTARTTASKQLHETIASFRESAFENSDANNILLVTGTPFENNLNELWTLLEMSNANNLLPRATCNSLMKDTLLTTIKQMINLCEKDSKANENLIEEYVLISFAQFMGLRNMVQKMVHRKDTSDPQVIEDWKGRIPSKSIRKILYELDPQTRDYLNEVQEGRRAISHRSLQTQILIHPDLAGQSLDAQENNRWPFLEPFRTGSDEVKEAWIKSSPYLSAVLTDAVFQASMINNQKRIIFCDRNALSAAFKETIKHFYQNAKVIIYNGDLKRLERDKAIAKFKNESSDHPTVLIAMIKAGGVGLNLAEADGRHICATQWNEGQKRQADARLIRANNVGEKDMPEIEFPETYYSAHPKAIRKKKRNWENFLWNSSESPKDLFRSWTTVLKAETLQVLLNTTIEDGNRRNTESAKAKNQQISDLLDRFCDSIPEERLNRAIALAMGASSRASLEQSRSPTELSDDSATSTSEEERISSPSELSDDFAPAPAAPIGLGNKSNNCWCNALLQMVASTPSLRASYESFARHYISNPTALSFGFAASSSSPQRSYLDEYYGQAMLSALDLYDRSEEALSPDISQNVREALNHFSSGAISIASSHNEDAYEALSILLQGSEPNSSLYTPLSTIRTYSPIRGLPALPDPRKLANNEYSTLEEGNRSTMTTAVPEILLPLQENENLSFSNLLGQFFDSAALPDTPPSIYLKGYGLFKYQLQRIQNQFQSIPHEFLLQLGRFRKEGPQDEPVLHKINTPVAVPLILTLPPEAIAASIETPPSYQLDSFIVHSGDREGGHYFTYKKLEEQWWLCNDSHVEPVALQDIEGILSGGMTTYLHHYTRQP